MPSSLQLFILFCIHCIGSNGENKIDCSSFECEFDYSCKPHSIDSLQQCDYIKCCCQDTIGDGMIDYLSIMYCDFNNNKITMVVILLITMIYAFVILAMVSDQYFAPLMENITEYLNLSPDVAGATFLAWGNGVPDISSSITAISHGGEQIKLGLGALLGVSVFDTQFIVGTIAWCCSNSKLSKIPLLRDTIYLIFITSMLMIICLRGQINTYQSIGVVSIYIVYVILVIVSVVRQLMLNKKSQSNLKERAQTMLDSIHSKVTIESIIHSKVLTATRNERIAAIQAVQEYHIILKILLTVLRIPLIILSHLLLVTVPLPNAKHCNDSLKCLHCITGPLLLYFGFKLYDSGNILYIFVAVVLGVTMSLIVFVKIQNEKSISLKRLLENKDSDDYGTVDRDVTEMSSTVQKRGSREKKENDDNKQYYKMSSNDKNNEKLAKQPVMNGFFLFFSFLILVTWIKLIAEELVSILTVLGVISRIDLTILGMTILAWGNAIPDFMNNLSVAKKGYATMATSACFGGTSMDITIGVGIGTLIGSLQTDNLILKMPNSTNIFIGCIFTIVGCALYAVIVACSKWQLNKIFGVCGYSYYFSFLFMSILIYQGTIKLPLNMDD